MTYTWFVVRVASSPDPHGFAASGIQNPRTLGTRNPGTLFSGHNVHTYALHLNMLPYITPPQSSAAGNLHGKIFMKLVVTGTGYQ